MEALIVPDSSEFYRALTETNQAIGRVAETVAAMQVHITVLVAGQDDIKRSLADDRERAKASREHIARDVELIRERLEEVERAVETLGPIGKKVDKLERQGWRREAAIGGIGAGFAAVVGAAIWARDAIRDFFSWPGG